MKFRWYCSNKNTSTSTFTTKDSNATHNQLGEKKKKLIQSKMFLVENLFGRKICCTETITTYLLKKKKYYIWLQKFTI